MGRKVKRSLSYKENNSPEVIENKTDLTDDTDIIECSIVRIENKYNVLNAIKSNSKRSARNIHTDIPLKDVGNPDAKTENNSVSSFRLSLRSNKNSEDKASLKGSEFLFHTPQPNRNSNSNSVLKKVISTLKKTPEGSLLSKSKLRNIQQWLRDNDVETVRTPPFANLSVTPVRSSKKLPKQLTDKDNKQDSSIDSEVEDILKAVYGDEWKQKNVHTHCKTEPKKKSNIFSAAKIRSEAKAGTYNSARRNILKGKKLNLYDSSDEDVIELETSVMSGVEVINADCSFEQIRPKQLGNIAKSSVKSFSLSPAVKINSKKIPGSNKKIVSRNLTSKKTEVELKTPKKTFLASLSVSTPNSRCHPDAQDFKVNFKSKKDELVQKLYKLYNSEIFNEKLPEDMSFSWNVKLRGTAGYCYNKRITKSTGDIIRLSRIEFSSKIVDRADRLRDTMIHELCHAASWVIDGVLDGHGAVWSSWASKAMSRFPELPMIKRCHNYDIVSKYVYRCTGCGYSIKRHSKSINTERKRCGHCYGVLELLMTKKKRGKGEIPEYDTTRTLRTPNKFALFVKENYQSVKSTKSNAKHAEIMKMLSQQYALSKNGRTSTKKSDD